MMSKYELKKIWVMNDKPNTCNAYDLMVYNYRRRGVEGVAAAFMKPTNLKRHSGQEVHDYRMPLAQALWMLRWIVGGTYNQKYYTHDYMLLVKDMTIPEIIEMNNAIITHLDLKSYLCKLIP